MQGGDRAPAYPGIEGGMGLCESTLPQLGRSLRPQEKGNNVGWLVYMGQRKGEVGRYPHRLGVHTYPCTEGPRLRMLPPHPWLMPLDSNLRSQCRKWKVQFWGNESEKGGLWDAKELVKQRVQGGTDIELERNEID